MNKIFVAIGMSCFAVAACGGGTESWTDANGKGSFKVYADNVGGGGVRIDQVAV